MLDHHRLTAPGACDNGAGVAGMLAVAAALEHAGIQAPGICSLPAMSARKAKATCAECVSV